MYSAQVDELARKGTWSAIVGGMAGGLAKGVPMMVFGVVFWYGGRLVNEDVQSVSGGDCAAATAEYDVACATASSRGTDACSEAEEAYKAACSLNDDFCFSGDTDYLIKFLVPSM
eukprot:6206689-Pleurochrysis_carterae.AAC.1